MWSQKTIEGQLHLAMKLPFCSGVITLFLMEQAWQKSFDRRKNQIYPLYHLSGNTALCYFFYNCLIDVLL